MSATEFQPSERDPKQFYNELSARVGLEKLPHDAIGFYVTIRHGKLSYYFDNISLSDYDEVVEPFDDFDEVAVAASDMLGLPITSSILISDQIIRVK